MVGQLVDACTGMVGDWLWVAVIAVVVGSPNKYCELRRSFETKGLVPKVK